VETVLNFTALLIEHSYARHIYNSTEVSLATSSIIAVAVCVNLKASDVALLSLPQHLCVLLACPDLDVVLAVLNLFYVFRSALGLNNHFYVF
jgi:hypothetical protein